MKWVGNEIDDTLFEMARSAFRIEDAEAKNLAVRLANAAAARAYRRINWQTLQIEYLDG